MAETQEKTISEAVPPVDFAEDCFWHARNWAALTRDPSKLSHALLLHGPGGVGKRAFGWRLAHALLCAHPKSDAEACGNCSSCHLFTAGNHPDLMYVAPLGDSRSIVIDQIRAVREFVALRPHTALRKLVLLAPADAMNLNSANALLKLLEEPPVSSLLLLISSVPAQLPATIRSRCTPVPFRPPPAADTVEWLRERGVEGESAAMALRLGAGAPLRALAIVRAGELAEHAEWLRDVQSLQAGEEDPLRCTARWKGYGVDRCLEWLQRYVADSLDATMQSAGTDKKSMFARDLFEYFDVLSEAKALSKGPLDETLLLENVLIGWFRLFRPVV